MRPASINRSRAAVLVLTLWIVVVMTVIATSLAFEVQVSSKLALLTKNQFLAQNLAKSAVAVGMTHLQNDILMDNAEDPQQMVDAFCDVWAQSDRREKEVEVELGKGTYELEIVDEEGKINLNFANQRLMKALLLYYDYDDEDAEEVANALVDFRDPDDKALGQGGDNENEYYSALMGQRIERDQAPEELIYKCPNENYLSVDQLLDVFGVDPVVFHGYDPESVEAKETKIRNDIAMGKRPVAQKKKRSLHERLPLKDIVTVRGSGRLNINTASVEALTVVLYAAGNLADLEAAQTAAEAIAKYRGDGRRGHTPRRDDAFKSMADLAKVPGVAAPSVAQISGAGALGVQLAFRSDTFSVTGIGRVGSVRKTVTAVVARNLDTFNPDDARLMSNKGKIGAGRRGGFAGRRPAGLRRGGKETDNYIRIPAVRVMQWIE